MSTCGLVFVFLHLQEDWKKLTTDYCPGKNYPQLCLGEQVSIETLITWKNFSIYVENVMVGSTGSFVEALQIILGTYYVFNIEYPKELVRSMTFFQKAVLSRNTQCKKIMKVIKLIASMNTVEWDMQWSWFSYIEYWTFDVVEGPMKSLPFVSLFQLGPVSIFLMNGSKDFLASFFCIKLGHYKRKWVTEPDFV